MSTNRRLSRISRDKPDHEDECLCWDSDGRPDICRYIEDENMWVDRNYNVVDVVYWQDLSELSPEW